MPRFRFWYREGCGVFGDVSAFADDEITAKQKIINEPGPGPLLKPEDLIPKEQDPPIQRQID